MIVVAIFLGVVVVAMVAWYLVQARRKKHLAQLVTDHWLDHHNYPKNGDAL